MAVVHVDDELVRSRVVREQLERDHVALIDREGRPGLRDVVRTPPPAHGSVARVERDGHGLLGMWSYRGHCPEDWGCESGGIGRESESRQEQRVGHARHDSVLLRGEAFSPYKGFPLRLTGGRRGLR